MYYRNDQDPNNYEFEINTENNQLDRHEHKLQMSPMSHCPWMETCPMKESCPMMGQPNMMAQMDPADPDPHFGRHFHHFHHHFHRHFFHPFFPHFHHHRF